VFDDEFEELAKTVRAIEASGVDAVIMQGTQSMNVIVWVLESASVICVIQINAIELPVQTVFLPDFLGRIIRCWCSKNSKRYRTQPSGTWKHPNEYYRRRRLVEGG